MLKLLEPMELSGKFILQAQVNLTLPNFFLPHAPLVGRIINQSNKPMKELTKKQKLDFLDYAMGEIDERMGYFFTCEEVCEFANVGHLDWCETAELLFPELMFYSAREDRIEYWEPSHTTDIAEMNQTRAIIYAFLWNELTGEIKID